MDVFLRLLLDHVGNIIEGNDADQTVAGIHNGSSHPVVALEQARDLLLVLNGTDPRPIFFHQVQNGHRPLAAQQSVKRYGSEKVSALIHHIEFVEMVRQFRRFAHVIDGLADIPIRRHRNEFRLHASAGQLFGVIQTARQRDAFGLRQLLENFGLFVLRQVFEDGDGVVGFQFAYALCDGLGWQLLENFLANRVVNFGQRGEVEIDTKQFDKALPLFWRQGLDERAHVGFVQVTDQRAQTGAVPRFDPACDAFDEGLADGAVLVARQLRSLGAVRLFLIEHVEACRQDESATLVRPTLHFGQ